jgi:hypothetical protein
MKKWAMGKGVVYILGFGLLEQVVSKALYSSREPWKLLFLTIYYTVLHNCILLHWEETSFC